MLGHAGSAVGSLYVHVPFCAQKCAYCAFFSETSERELINGYVASLAREMEISVSGLRPKTVFFGGGTPSFLNLRQWQAICRAMERLNLLGADEFTVECNPATISLDKARLLRDYGVNRISMGVQSLHEDLLERLGRIHSRQMVFKSFDLLRRAGFENLNLDLMFAIPGQTLEIWHKTLDEALALGSEHLSCYEVIYEEDTPLFRQLQAREFDMDEDLACLMYEALRERATAVGFHQYEVANFARHTSPSPRPSATNSPSFACHHNINYWRGGSFHGLGPSATSYVRGVRSKNWASTKVYCEQIERGQRAIESLEELVPLSRAGETAAFGLRMVEGWPFEEFRRTTGFDLREDWAADMDSLVHCGWASRSEERFQLSSEGLRFADAAAELFLR